jgi:hypothetical protein
MEYSVKLARLPANLEFPARLQDRVTFDPAKEQLSYRGFMTKCAYDELSSLSDDLDYHRALEQLFVITSGEMAPVGAKRRFPAAIVLATIGVGAVVFAGLWAAARHGSVRQSSDPTPAIAVSVASP